MGVEWGGNRSREEGQLGLGRGQAPWLLLLPNPNPLPGSTQTCSSYVAGLGPMIHLLPSLPSVLLPQGSLDRPELPAGKLHHGVGSQLRLAAHPFPSVHSQSLHTLWD